MNKGRAKRLVCEFVSVILTNEVPDWLADHPEVENEGDFDRIWDAMQDLSSELRERAGL